jgi:hypothetical protein
MAWATLAQFKENQVNLANTGDPLITLSLNATADQITSCLYSGGYAVSTLEAAVVAGAVYDLLVLLNIRLAALDLMDGGGTSTMSGANENTYKARRNWCEKWLEKLCAGDLGLSNSGTGDDVVPPTADREGIIDDDREVGMDLTDPVTWENGDPVNADYDGYEV